MSTIGRVRLVGAILAAFCLTMGMNHSVQSADDRKPKGFSEVPQLLVLP